MSINQIRFYDQESKKVKDVLVLNLTKPATATMFMAGLVNYVELVSNGKLLQFTGLKNLGGEDIYEGDIYEVDGYGVGSVVIDPLFGTVIQRKDGSQITMLNIRQLDLDYIFLGDYSQKDTIRFYNHELTDN